MKEYRLAQKANGQENAYVGFYLNEVGKRLPKRFWLGKDEGQARKNVAILGAMYSSDDTKDSTGKRIWSTDTLQKAQMLCGLRSTVTITAAIAPQVTQVVPSVASVASESLTFSQAIDAYVKRLNDRQDCGEDNKETVAKLLTSIKHYTKEITHKNYLISDLPMPLLDTEALDLIRNKILSRPLTRNNCNSQTPIKVSTVKVLFVTLSMFLDWCDRTPRIGWVGPRHWKDAFLLSQKQALAIMTPEEKDGKDDPKEIYTIGEVKEIYKRNPPGIRKYILFGLFCGFKQKDIATLRKEHFVQINGEYFIDRSRGKTGVPGMWWIPTELATMIIRSAAKTNPDNLLFLTPAGNALVHNKKDTIGNSWDTALNRSASKITKRIPFGKLRHLGAQIIQNLSSHAFAQTFLAHKQTSMAAKHYVSQGADCGIGESQYAQLHKVQKQAYQELLKMDFFGNKATEATLASEASEASEALVE